MQIVLSPGVVHCTHGTVSCAGDKVGPLKTVVLPDSSTSTSCRKAWLGLNLSLFGFFGNVGSSKLLFSVLCVTVRKVRVVFFKH